MTSSNNHNQSQHQQGQQNQSQNHTQVNNKTNSNNKINLLIFNPSPRAIRQFEYKVKLLNSKYDIYRVKFDFNELHAFNAGRDFFLYDPQGRKYTHMAILPDDLLVELHHVDKLVSDLEKNPKIDVLSAVCNWSYVNQKFFNTLALIPFDSRGSFQLFKNQAKYKFDSLLQREQYNKEPKGIQRVLFAAFSFTIASRRVIEQFGFTPIQPAGLVADGMGLDTIFYNNCLRKGINCYADYDVMTLHIKDMEYNNDVSYGIRYADEHNVSTKVIKSPRFKQENVLLKAGSIS